MDIKLKEYKQPEYLVQEKKPEINIRKESDQLKDLVESNMDLNQEIKRLVDRNYWKVKVFYIQGEFQDQWDEYDRFCLHEVERFVIPPRHEVLGGFNIKITIRYYPVKKGEE